MTKRKSTESPSQHLVNSIVIIIVVLLVAKSAIVNYYLLYMRSEDVVVLNARITDKLHKHVQFREYWNLKIDYNYNGEIYHSTTSCSKENFQILSPGDSIMIKINKNKPDYLFHIHDGILRYKDVF